jgi:hypothetical protein
MIIINYRNRNRMRWNRWKWLRGRLCIRRGRRNIHSGTGDMSVCRGREVWRGTVLGAVGTGKDAPMAGVGVAEGAAVIVIWGKGPTAAELLAGGFGYKVCDDVDIVYGKLFSSKVT